MADDSSGASSINNNNNKNNRNDVVLPGPPPVQRMTTPTLESFPEPVLVETVNTEEEVVEEEDVINEHQAEEDRKQAQLERTITWIIYLILAFFAALIVLTVVLVLYLTKAFFVLTILLVLVLLCISFGYFVQDTLHRDLRDWKPVTAKIDNFAKATTNAIMEEWRNFKAELDEHLLLTDGHEYDDGEDEEQVSSSHANYVAAPDGGVPNASAVEGESTKRKKKKKKREGKSVLFKVVKPFLRIRRPRIRRKQKQQQQDVENAPGYIPPIV